jgi:hypothetical protein
VYGDKETLCFHLKKIEIKMFCNKARNLKFVMKCIAMKGDIRQCMHTAVWQLHVPLFKAACLQMNQNISRESSLKNCKEFKGK